MKKSVLFVSLFMSGVIYLHAQCTITPGCSATAGYCSTPASGTALPNATELMGYSTTIQVTLGTTVSGITINNATVTSVTGLPTGLSYSLNPSSGILAAGASGCVLIAGTPAAGTAGTYTITANVTVNTSLGASPQTITWLLTVNATTGIAHATAVSSNIIIMPNPALNNITVNSNRVADNSNIQIADILGNELMQTNLQQGKATIDISNLQPGVYLIRTNSGIQKFIKQ